MSASPPSYQPDPKATLRRQMLSRRKTVHAEKGAAASQAVARRVVEEFLAAGKCVAGYWPIGDELDPRPALEAVIGAGGAAALPVVAGQGQVLLFRQWNRGDPLESGPFGTAHPTPRAEAVTPDVLLLPLIAYDKTGHRLGYGAGYYDRTVQALRDRHAIVVIGLAYDEQEIDAVPAGSHDQRLDAIITDKRAVWFNSAAQSRLK
jgi:5-formyltetrahydrofolate cyclo-ligase